MTELEVCIVDYSTARPAARPIVAAGYVGVVRYLAPLPNRKVLTAGERDELLAAGLSIVLVWETVNQRAAGSGYDGGRQDATRAIAMARELEVPDGAGIYYVLEDPTRLPAAQWAPAFAYAQGVRDVGGPYRRGGYGSQALLEEAHRRGLIELLWQVGTWSAGVSMIGHLYQRVTPAHGPIPDTDEDVCLQPDWGQWPRPVAPSSPDALPLEEDDDMAKPKHVVVMDDGTEYAIVDDTTPPKRWHIPDEHARDAGVILGLWDVATPGPSPQPLQDFCARLEIIAAPLK